MNAAWREAEDICALADSERHLGHAIRAQNHWVAYDAVHFNPTNDGFRVIGTFASVLAAKNAVESSVFLDMPGSFGVDVPGAHTKPRFARRLSLKRGAAR
jgi:hypothetical protein